MKKTSKLIKKKVKKKKKVVKKKVAKKKVAKKKATKKKKTTKKKTKKKVVKKKKAVKKKTTKKKIVKKSKKTKKKRKVKRKKKVSMEDFYKILNKVQISRKPACFAVTLLETDVIENIVKDTGLKYSKSVMKTQTVFTIIPNEEDTDFPKLDVEYMDDEIAEEGQIFP